MKNGDDRGVTNVDRVSRRGARSRGSRGIKLSISNRDAIRLIVDACRLEKQNSFQVARDSVVSTSDRIVML